MVDLMFVVDDTLGFHRDNLAANPHHYSSVRRLGPAAVARVQTSSFGARVYFNTLVPAGDAVTFKYGVIDARDFRRDLRSWRTLYTAGRLHKPVSTLLLRDRGLNDLVARNLRSAVHAALLQLPGRFAEVDLYTAVAGLSYLGDFRMIVGEDRNKVANIVRPQTERFRLLYAPVFRSMDDRLLCGADSIVEQDDSADSKLYHLRQLPQHLKNVLLGSDCDNAIDGDVKLQELAMRDDLGTIVRNGIRKIVFYSSLLQSIKGIPMAGLQKSVVYSYNKLNKMVKSILF